MNQTQLDEPEEVSSLFSDSSLAPSNLPQVRTLVSDFCTKSQNENRPVVLVTSGGTTVPLEHNTVRFVDNFSAGTRGSISAEYFLEHGYAVIYLFRTKTLEPFSRHFTVDSLFRAISEKDGVFQLNLNEEEKTLMQNVTEKYQRSKDRLLKITFTTLFEYLFLLREITCYALRPLGSQAMLYLAAAVSDFYIPLENMETHKIQSNNGPLSLHLELVPKILRPLVKHWVPDAFVISFKLETDENILLNKSRIALKNYGHHLVIANILNTRRFKATIVEESSHEDITMSAGDGDIEAIIVERVVKKHLKRTTSST